MRFPFSVHVEWRGTRGQAYTVHNPTSADNGLPPGQPGYPPGSNLNAGNAQQIQDLAGNVPVISPPNVEPSLVHDAGSAGNGSGNGSGQPGSQPGNGNSNNGSLAPANEAVPNGHVPNRSAPHGTNLNGAANTPGAAPGPGGQPGEVLEKRVRIKMFFVTVINACRMKAQQLRDRLRDGEGLPAPGLGPTRETIPMLP